jgi:hypothetical protein
LRDERRLLAAVLHAPAPYPNPFCADQNAWAFITAFWEEADPDPIEPFKPLPSASGLILMLAPMNVLKGQVGDG